MYDPGPTDAELAIWGLMREDVIDTSVTEIWPENWLPFEVFRRMTDQWYSGMNGPTGLNYTSFDLWYEAARGRRKDRAGTLDALQVMARAALKQMHKEK